MEDSFLNIESSINFYLENDSIPASARALLDKKKFISCNESKSDSPYLSYIDGAWNLIMPSGLDLQIDFSSQKYNRIFSPSSDLLCRACGWHLGMRSIVDLTAGLGVDAVMLAQAGFNVKAIERNAYLSVLMILNQDNLSPSLKLSFYDGEAEGFMSSLAERPEVIYYDPMYPGKKKSALPSKELQVLRELNGKDGEDVDLLKHALKIATKRVVVKRPLQALPIIDKPQSVVKGKLVRFDLYRPRS